MGKTPICQDVSCTEEATHSLIWEEERRCYCPLHAQGKLVEGYMVGNYLPEITLCSLPVPVSKIANV